jgi:hypothetical protein
VGWEGIKDTAGDWPSTAYEKIAGSPGFTRAGINPALVLPVEEVTLG